MKPDIQVGAGEKYWAVFSLSLQQEFYHRASFLMDRARSITIVIAFYAFWSAIFEDRSSLLGYTKSQMFTYVLGMNILRSLVFSNRTWDIIREINLGIISSYLLRPISYIGYSLSRDAADKIMNFISSLLEVLFAIWILDIAFYVPGMFSTLIFFSIAVFLAMILYFLMSYAISALAFWTAESGGPRFCFELFLEFAAGAFFPLDVLPSALKQLFEFLPFSSLVYFPLNVFLERLPPSLIMRGLMIQMFWLIVLIWLARFIWQKGLRVYAAEGG